MGYINTAYFERLERQRKKGKYLLAGLATGLAGALSFVGVRGLTDERPSLERAVVASTEKLKPVKSVQPKTQAPKRKEVIVLDPGHGMSNRTDGVYDPGAVSGEYKEAELVLAQAKKIKEYLEARGYTVQLTREDAKTSTPLGSRNTGKGDAFVSLHYNASDNASANGTEVLYNDEESKELANHIHQAVVRAIETRDRGLKHRPGLRVLKGGKTPSVIVETGFISNPGDRAKASGYADERAIADAIHAYLQARSRR